MTAVIAILLALWLSKRITAPVTALTEGTQAIAQGDSTRLPITSSDELGKMSAGVQQDVLRTGDPAGTPQAADK